MPDLTSFKVYGCSINSIDGRVNEKTQLPIAGCAGIDF
jgi:hypothetical protein